MNTLPSVPTDNLYKFCAISGVATMLLGAFSFYRAWRDYAAGARWFDDEWMKTPRADTFWTQTLENREAEASKNWNKSQPDAPVIMLVSWIAGTAGFCGLPPASYGFRNWRILQVRQDRLLEIELTKET